MAIGVPRDDHTEEAAKAAATGSISSFLPSGTAMSWPWTRMLMRVWRPDRPRLWRRDPIMARISSINRPVGRAALSHAESWMIRFKPPRYLAAILSASDSPTCCRDRCAATSRTVQPEHSDGRTHSSSDSRASNAIVFSRWPSMAAHIWSSSMA